MVDFKEILSNGENFERLTRTPRGLLKTECVDRRLIDVSGVARIPGNSLGTATVLLMNDEASALPDALLKLPAKGQRPGVHRETCAYDHNIGEILGLIASQSTSVAELYNVLRETVPTPTKVARFGSVAVGAGMALERLGDHQPDKMADFVAAELTEPHVVSPGRPVENAAAFVIDSDTSHLALDGGVPSGLFYYDTHAKAVAHSGMPTEYMPGALAVSAATAVLVAETHNLPIVVAWGVPGGTREFVDFSA